MSSFSQIATNIQSLQAFQNLQDTSSELSTRRERLSTGKRINSAGDDSAGFAIANKLEARTRGQSQALRNIGDAQSVLSVAEGGLDSSLDILQTQKEKAVQAANDSLGDAERADIQSQLLDLTGEVNDIADNAEFNGKKLLNGAGGTSQDLTFQVGAENGDQFDVSINSAKANDIGIEDSSRNQIMFEGGFDNKDASFTGSVTSTATETAPNEFNVELSQAGTATDQIAVTVQTAGGSEATTTLTGLNNTNSGTTASTTVQLTDGSGGLTAGTAASGLRVQVSNDQVNEVINESGDGSLTAFSTKSSLDVSSASNANTAISTVDNAINEVSDQLASIGDAQTRLDFKEGNLETSRTNLESARSQIEDADFAREQTQIAKLQILQQTGTAQLAQANAASQNVLSLVGQ